MKQQSPVIMPNNRIPKVPTIARTTAKDVGKSAADVANMMKQLKSARNMK